MQLFQLNICFSGIRTILSAIIFLIQFQLTSQNNENYTVLGSAGEFSTTTSSSLHFQIGEVIVSSSRQGNEILLNGFIQPSSGLVVLKNNILPPDFNVFPNPFSKSFLIRCSDCANLFFELIDISGKHSGKVIIDEINSTTIQFNTNPLNPGVYFLFIKNSGNEILAIKKMVKIEN